ncbi:Tetratricopeptide TPR_1 repeat-containing protein [Pseudodesulfovibrio mercurii]|uniref:Tetratricopeptide TPR_1 repeat-containing protein n=1 Tax=Pseudodesulfovibrio mercurii TaxID=641491 RepID=F0JIQ6_9BACT|nr:tetratricopeptide repeat protein [Pseudodesulfovibrio mercurii]EGB15490.1 Tetratricopeptide TPR_1 repeat-containing protein [Pseudodesulfovibrio mercurii]
MRRILVLILLAATVFAVAACSSSGSPGREDIERARDSYSKGFYLEAEKDYERYLQVEPQGKFRKEAWDRLAEIAVSIKGDLDRAVVLLEAMYLELGDDPDTAWKIMFQLGEVYSELGNNPKAIECFEKCLIHAQGNPEHTYKTQLRMARLYRNMGSYDLVAGTLENCADSAADDEAKARCLYELAQSYTFISSWSQASKTLDSLLRLKHISDETRALAIFLQADIAENDRDYAKTRELLESILHTYPNPKVVETRLANLPEVVPEPLPLVPPRQ